MFSRSVDLTGLKRRRSPRRRRGLLFCFVVVLAIGAVVGAKTIFGPSSTKAGTPSVQPQLTFGARQAVDVNLVAGAIGQYAAANNALPTHLETLSNTSLVLCGITCDPTNYQVSGLGVYQAPNVKLVPYAPELAAPDQNVMYLVPGASCGINGKLSGINTSPRSMVVLYQVVTTSGSSVPRCQVL